MGVTMRWRRCAWLWWCPTGGTDPAIGSTTIHIVTKTRTSLMYPLRASCAQVAGTVASDILDAYRAGVPWRSQVWVHAHNCLDSIKKIDRLDAGPG